MPLRPDAPIEEKLGKNLDFLRCIWSLDHALHARSKAMVKRTGVTALQRLTLRIIGLFQPVTSGELARVLKVHPSTLTGVLQRLEKQNLVQRKRDAGDARRALFHLSRQGEKLAGPIDFSVEGAVRRVLKRLPAADMATTRRVMLALADELLEGTVAGQREDEA